MIFDGTFYYNWNNYFCGHYISLFYVFEGEGAFISEKAYSY